MPYRVMLPKKVEGLLAVGCCASALHDGRITVMDLDGDIKAEIGYPYSVIRAHSVWVDQVGDIYFASLSRGTGFYKLIRQK